MRSSLAPPNAAISAARRRGLRLDPPGQGSKVLGHGRVRSVVHHRHSFGERFAHRGSAAQDKRQQTFAQLLTQHLADAQGTGPNPQLATLLGTGDAGHVRWSHVLLQEQSQIPGFALSNAQRMSSMSSTVSLSGYVAATGATTVLLMTWGYAKGDPTNPTIFPDYPTMQSLLTTGYEQMAQAVATAGHAVKVAPAGLAFQAVYQREKTMGQDPLASGSLFLQLYGPDFIHPAVPGTFLAACVVTATIYGVDPTTLTGSVAGIDAATQLVLETAARDAVAAQNAMPAP